MKKAEKPKDFFETLDAAYQSRLSKMTSGVSPTVMQAEFFAWLGQLAMSPGKMMRMMLYPQLHSEQIIKNLTDEAGISGGTDVRFSYEKWKEWPWRGLATNYLMFENWWQEATTNVMGLDGKTERSVSFLIRKLIEVTCPTNYPFMNPEVVEETVRTGGTNWTNGMRNAVDDIFRTMTKQPPAGTEDYEVGKNLAITPGKVVLRTHLLELIQYEPKTTSVYKEPILIIPAWIMKYYILDLSPNNSLVKWLTEQGHTVFIGSWRNPSEEDRNIGLDDYFREGAMAAIDAVSSIVPNAKIHLVGYCLGGTLAMLTTAYMAAKKDNRLASLTALAAQGDFSEAGELLLFVNESKIEFLEKMLLDKGYLDSKQMATTFQMLRSYDLIWSKIVHEYLMGRRDKLIDLMAWNADATRLPYKMFSEYLKRLYIRNEFVEGRMTLEDFPVAPENINVPVFAVGTEKDHVVPWHSAFKIHLMASTSVTFALTNSGHNAGIVNPPGKKRRYYRIHERKSGDPYLSPDLWREAAELRQEESWWIGWQKWLVDLSSPEKVSPPSIGSSAYKPLSDAPGEYVMQK